MISHLRYLPDGRMLSFEATLPGGERGYINATTIAVVQPYDSGGNPDYNSMITFSGGAQLCFRESSDDLIAALRASPGASSVADLVDRIIDDAAGH